MFIAVWLWDELKCLSLDGRIKSIWWLCIDTSNPVKPLEDEESYGSDSMDEPRILIPFFSKAWWMRAIVEWTASLAIEWLHYDSEGKPGTEGWMLHVLTFTWSLKKLNSETQDREWWLPRQWEIWLGDVDQKYKVRVRRQFWPSAVQYGDNSNIWYI